MPVKVTPCIDLSNETQEQTRQDPRGLCIVCQKIDFVSLTSKRCCPRSYDNRHFHIGKLRDAASDRFCPGCRLILSVTRSTDLNHKKFDESTITIQGRFPYCHYWDPNDDFPEKIVDENNIERLAYPHPSMEIIVEVILDENNSQYERPKQPRVIGTIIRLEETGRADFCGQKSTSSELEGPNFRGRVVLPNANISLIKQWMQTCSVQHDHCQLPILAIAREQSIRLIDVQDYRLIPATLTEKYAALSYVWGPNLAPCVIRDSMLRCSSIGGLKDMTVPRTIMDAMQLVKCIGMRYLWVDSLCIVQDDDEDKGQQIKIMDSIYISAELLIVAAAGSDANAGLPGIGSTPRRVSQTIEKITGTQFITAQPSVQQVLDRSVWNSRGWTFQESTLSRRALIFTESLIYWSCQADTWREDIGCESPVVGLMLNEANSLRPQPSRESRPRSCRTSLYCRLAEAFSWRVLKDERDVVWAFIGILRLQTAQFQKGFIWALPYEGLDTTLLWVQLLRCRNTHSRQAYHTVIRKGRRYNLTYPSWSWLSTNEPIEFIDSCGASIVSEVTWHAPLNFDDETLATYLEPVSLKDGGNIHDRKPMIDLLAGPTPERDIMDYGFLRFTAQTTVLTLRREEEKSEDIGARIKRARDGDEADGYKRKSLRDYWVRATICSSQEKQIGMLTVSSHYFDEKSERTGEVILLSSKAEKKSDGKCIEVTEGDDLGKNEHVKGCRHVQSRNIMLIEREGNIAYRRGVCEIDKKDWEDVKTETKTIILG